MAFCSLELGKYFKLSLWHSLVITLRLQNTQFLSFYIKQIPEIEPFLDLFTLKILQTQPLAFSSDAELDQEQTLGLFLTFSVGKYQKKSTFLKSALSQSLIKNKL